MNLLTINKSFDDVEEEFTLQDEIEDRDDALEELSSILGGSSSCPSFSPSGTFSPVTSVVKFERPGCIPKFIHKRTSRMSVPCILRNPGRTSFDHPSHLLSQGKDTHGIYF